MTDLHWTLHHCWWSHIHQRPGTFITLIRGLILNIPKNHFLERQQHLTDLPAVGSARSENINLPFSANYLHWSSNERSIISQTRKSRSSFLSGKFKERILALQLLQGASTPNIVKFLFFYYIYAQLWYTQYALWVGIKCCCCCCCCCIWAHPSDNTGWHFQQFQRLEMGLPTK